MNRNMISCWHHQDFFPDSQICICGLDTTFPGRAPSDKRPNPSALFGAAAAGSCIVTIDVQMRNRTAKPAHITLSCLRVAISKYDHSIFLLTWIVKHFADIYGRRHRSADALYCRICYNTLSSYNIRLLCYAPSYYDFAEIIWIPKVRGYRLRAALA